MSQRTLRSYVEGAERQFPEASDGEAGLRPADCIDIVTPSGDRFGFPYGHLLWARMRGAVRIDIVYGTHSAQVEGESLEALYRAVLDRTCRRIAVTSATGEHATSAPTAPAKEPAPVVRSVAVLQRPNPVADPPDVHEPPPAPTPTPNNLDPSPFGDAPEPPPAWNRQS